MTTKTTTRTKRARLLANMNIKRWYDNLARGSTLTAEGRPRRLERFCEVHDMTPAHLADLAIKDLRTTTDLLEDHITMVESKGYSPGYVDEQQDRKVVATTLTWRYAERYVYPDITLHQHCRMNEFQTHRRCQNCPAVLTCVPLSSYH